MISTPLVICLAVASAVIVVALMMRKQRRPSRDAAWSWREATFASMLLSFAASVGLARARAEQSGEGNDSGHNWHGSHLNHGPHGGFSDGGGGYSGGDGGGGGI